MAKIAATPRASSLSPGAVTARLDKGRYDRCVGIRAVPVRGAMMACVLADHLLRHRGQVGWSRTEYLFTVVTSVA
ncbi:hypothetical protein [Bradyrhizobium sp. HKCCYLRH3061]|uniref:hypothetical protein n=1 Tax=Bradyrhizobium sp. HKCCYLRH3061 TaxID=3420734 RepID=UPI003EB8DA85